MKRAFKVIALSAIVAAMCMQYGCHPGTPADQHEQDSLAMRKKYAESPVLSPEEELKTIRVVKGMDIHLVASEPLVHTPIALTFDPSGRIWAIEMNDYMHDTSGAGEDQPTGQIVILTDTDRNGTIDKSQVFMDSLLMPRAICLVNNGLLVAEPPNLWFVKNINDKAGPKMLVDSTYAIGGNVEHKPNGLLRGMDNWIYNAKSDKRYHYENGKWIVEHTHFRGQWGITQDNYGRVFYNNNSVNLLGDYFSPGLGAWNVHQSDVSGFNEDIIHNNRTYPIRATPGVNRGYMEDILDDSLRLRNFTAACGPVIYRDDVLGKEFENNVFVAEPAGNLIKRDILTEDGYKVSGKEAYKEEEFAASTDERFRPVSLYTGPDGALYVVDMYRGVIQHKTYLTPYLKNEIKMRRLQLPLNCGRIYKIYPTGVQLQPVDLSNLSAAELVGQLDNKNGWVRETAQHLLIDDHHTEIASQLRDKMQHDGNVLGKIHAFWTLQGLGLLTQNDIGLFLNSKDDHLCQQALTAISDMMDKGNAASWLKRSAAMLSTADDQVVPYLAFIAAHAMQFIPAQATPVLLKIAEANKDNRFVSDAVISGLQDKEKSFLSQFTAQVKDTNNVFAKHLSKIIARIDKERSRKENKALEAKLVKGKQLFETVCQTCHGADGDGIKSLGPPLAGSNWVQGDKDKLLSIVLVGLEGPIEVSGKLYKQPEVSGEMPSFAGNPEFTDEGLSQVINYIRNSWGNKADLITPEDVKRIRAKYKDRQQAFKMEDLR